ncbi:MAG: hypothetical protein M9939_25165 [Mesorhizobium sp.]|nr:hypothetical protein [Mesorhizobium sp.]MCO5164385.1 hypothetical protein [Mesorhizobium sp.]
MASSETDRNLLSMRVWILIGLIAPIVLFCQTYVALEDPVYPYDYGAYWGRFQRYGALIAADPTWWKAALSEIYHNDYNPAPVVPLFPFYQMFGGGRTTYIAAVALMYLLPTAAIAASISSWSDKRTDLTVWVAAFVLAITYLPFWSPTLLGMVDIVGLVFLGISTVVLFRSDFLRKSALLHAVALGVLLWAPFLLRRWYAFSVVSFFFIAFVVGILARWFGGERDWREYARFTAWLALSGVILLGFVAIFQGGLAQRILETSYRDAYAAYQKSATTHLLMVVNRCGWYVVSLVAVGFTVSIWRKDFRIIFAVSTGLLTFVLFASTQGLADHHFLPIAFMLFPAYFTGAYTVSSLLTVIPSYIRLVPICLIAVGIFVFAVTPGMPISGYTSFFVPKQLARPRTLENYAEYKRLIDYLKTHASKNDVAVFASSFVLSDQILIAVDSEMREIVTKTPHIASQGLFNIDMVKANYAIVPLPLQTMLAPGTQRNITIPAQMLLDRNGFGAAYEQIDATYLLAGGVRAYVFKQIRPVTAAEIRSLVDLILAAYIEYPGWRAKFADSLAPLFAGMRTEPGDVWGAVRPNPNDILLIHPGATTPTRVTLPFSIGSSTARIGRVAFSIRKGVLKTCPDADGVAYAIIVDGVPLKSGIVKPGDLVSETLPKQGDELTLSIDKIGTPSCDHLHAAFAR